MRELKALLLDNTLIGSQQTHPHYVEVEKWDTI